MKQLDVLFVNPNGAPIIYQDLSKDYSAIEPPIWAALLANHVRNKGFSVDILDCEAFRYAVEESLNEIKIRNPRLVVLVLYGQQPSASTQNMTGASLLCSALKYDLPNIKILMLGAHPSAVSRDVMEKEKCDFVCQGEGPYTIISLLQTDLESCNQLEKVPGLWFRKSLFFKFTPQASLITQEQLEYELPGMAWDLLPMDKYRTSNWHAFSNNNEKTPFVSVYTSLGCPYNCSYCMINSPFGNNNVENGFGKPAFRYWNPNFMITELEKIAKMGIRNLKIADEMFVLMPDHYVKLCEKIIEHRLDFNIWAYSRVNTVKEGYLDLMKRAGINWLALGVEAGSYKVRKNVVKGSFKEVDIVQTVRKIQDAGINVIGNFIFGLPEDNIESMQMTLDLATELNCEFANFYATQAYPGSKLYLEANKSDLPESYAGYSQHSYECKPLPTKYISSPEVLKFRDDAFLRYFTNQTYLEMIRKKFGENAYKGVLNMTQYNLKRKLLEQ